MKYINTLLFVLLSLSLFAQEEEVHFKKAEAIYNQGKYAEAVEHYSKAIEIKPDYTNAYLRRAFCYTASKQYEEAIVDFTKIIELNPGHPWATNSRGSAYTKLKEYDKALRDFNNLLQAEPKNTEALNNRGWAKDGKGDHKGACKDWKLSKKYGNPEAKLILKNTNCK